MIRPLLVALAAGLVACAAPMPGRIAVEVYRGLGGNAAGAFLPAVHVIVDATRSMAAQSQAASTHLDAAQSKARELIAALPPGTRVALHVLGGGSAEAPECAALEPLTVLGPASDPALPHALEELQPSGEGSISLVLAALLGELQRQARARDARVVLFTDLDARCGGDWCAAARELIDAGAWLDLVVLGEEPAPQCLEGLRPSAREPGALVRALTRPAAGWELRAPGSEAQDARVASGRAGLRPSTAPSGAWVLRVVLDPPLEIPLRIEPDRLTRVRVLDFAGGPARFAWEIADERP
jgi:hypothetical protein